MGEARLKLHNVGVIGGSASADLAESANVVGSGDIEYSGVLIENGNIVVKTAVAAENKFIQVASDDNSDNMAEAYLGDKSGMDIRNYGGTVDIHLANGQDNGMGSLNANGISLRGITKVQLGSGSSTIYGASDENNTIAAGDGAASVWGGGASNDTLVGNSATTKSGSVSYFYINGDGKDEIRDFTWLTSENKDLADRVNVLGAKVTGAISSGNDVIIELEHVNDRLTIKNAVGNDFIMDYGEVGAQQTLVAQVTDNYINYNGRANYLQATGRNATVVASSELDNAEIWLNNIKGDTFVGDIKGLSAANVEGRSTLVGNSNDNTITGSAGNASMWGGDQGGNDTLIGGAGADMFWYGVNNGHDVVTNVDSTDVVNLYDIGLDDIESAEITSNSITITLKESVGGDTLTVISNNSGIGFRLADDPGTTWTADQRSRNWSTK